MRRYGLAVLSVLVLAAALLLVFKPLDRGPKLQAETFATRQSSQVPLQAPSPSRVERRSFYSNSLQRDMRIVVYLPPGYDSTPNGSFPVIYMLHGLNGNEDAWSKCGLFKAADLAASLYEIPPMIIVTPEGDNGYWVDQANNGPRYGSYVANDLVGYMDAQYRTIPQRDSRAIGGMSMGGHGALQLAINFPDTFGVVGAHSVALRTYDQAFSFFGDKAYFSQHDPVELYQEYLARAKRLKIWIDIGTQDSWYKAASAFHDKLVAEGVPHEWHAFSGGHDVNYWTNHVPEYLAFYGRNLQTQSQLSSASLKSAP